MGTEVKTMDLLSPIYHFVMDEVDGRFASGSHRAVASAFFGYVVRGTKTDIGAWLLAPHMLQAMRQVADLFAQEELLAVAMVDQGGLSTVQQERLDRIVLIVNTKRIIARKLV